MFPVADRDYLALFRAMKSQWSFFLLLLRKKNTIQFKYICKMGELKKTAPQSFLLSRSGVGNCFEVA